MITRRTCAAKGCKNKLPKDRKPWVVWCSPECGAAIGLEVKRKMATAAEKKKKRDLRKKREMAKSRSWHLARTQAACNSYVRALYAGQGCYTCGTRDGQMQAGHCFSRGARPDLRFSPNNIRLQCVRCNDHLSGNVAEFKYRLRLELGEQFLALEIRGRSDWSLEELADMTECFRGMKKRLGK